MNNDYELKKILKNLFSTGVTKTEVVKALDQARNKRMTQAMRDTKRITVIEQSYLDEAVHGNEVL